MAKPEKLHKILNSGEKENLDQGSDLSDYFMLVDLNMISHLKTLSEIKSRKGELKSIEYYIEHEDELLHLLGCDSYNS